MSGLDTKWVRAQFPAFSEPTLADLAFFENAGGSYACGPVIDRLTRFYRARKVQPYGPFAASADAGAEMDEARSRLAEMLGVDFEELSFGPSTTQNTYVLARAVKEWIGDRSVVVTDQDHEANSGPWRRLAEEGVDIRVWTIDPDTGHLDPDRLRALVADGRVGMVCFPHCSNVVGRINDVAVICAIARAAGARSVVDGVSYAPHGLPDVGALGPDVYLFSAYKTYGPHQGLMVVRREFGAQLPNQGHFFNGDSLYKRFTPAGPDHAQVAACAGIADYIEALSRHHGGPERGAAAARFAHDGMRAAEAALAAPLLDFLRSRNDLRLIGPATAEDRAPTIAVAHARPGEALASDLARHGIGAGGGDFYAVRALRALGIDPDHGVLRLSMVHYTSPDEVDRVIEALEAIL